MLSVRGVAASLICLLLCTNRPVVTAGLSPPLGILTHAQDAWLNSAVAFPGLSVFAGEALSTSEEGRVGVRVGSATLAFARGAHATLQKLEIGTHVDLTSGSVFLTLPEDARIEVHAEDAMFKPEMKSSTQAEVRILKPKVLQVIAIRGNLEFSYRDEFQLIPEGETYRIDLDAPAKPQKPAGAGAPSIGPKNKTVIYIVTGVVATGLTVWGIRELIDSDRPVSPSNPNSPK